jgi:hypothetical protein
LTQFAASAGQKAKKYYHFVMVAVSLCPTIS